MTIFSLVGALLLLCGVVYLAAAAIGRGRLSDPRPNPNDTARPTLEPRQRGLGFLGIRTTWPGHLLILVGALLLLLPLLL